MTDTMTTYMCDKCHRTTIRLTNMKPELRLMCLAPGCNGWMRPAVPAPLSRWERLKQAVAEWWWRNGRI